MTYVILAGLGFGDESKGANCEYMCINRNAKLVIRYNGGPQAGHNVLTPDGKHHTFSQFGSGTFIPGVRTHLSKYMLVDPLAMETENRHLVNQGVPDAMNRLSVDPRATIITPIHVLLNRIREQNRDEKHGTCGCGVGEAVAHRIACPEYTLTVSDLMNPNTVRAKLWEMYFYAIYELESIGVNPADYAVTMAKSWWLRTLVGRYTSWISRISVEPDQAVCWSTQSDIVFEGAQGVMLDETLGTAPHNTWSNCTFDNAKAIIEENSRPGEVYRVGCLRTYYTRHGAGPFPTESPDLDILEEPHNSSSNVQGKFRRGHFDPVLARYAIQAVGGLEGIFLSHADKIKYLTKIDRQEYINQLESLVGASIINIASGPTRNHRSMVKKWPEPIKTIPSSTPKATMPDLRDLLIPTKEARIRAQTTVQ